MTADDCLSHKSIEESRNECIPEDGNRDTDA